MSKNRRILVEVLAPPMLAVIWVNIFSSHNSETLSVFIVGNVVLIVVAYLFGIIPAIIYAVAMELWFNRGLLVRFGLFCTVGWSVMWGALAGYCSAAIGRGLGFLTPSDWFNYLKAGAVIGLLIGFFVSRRKRSSAP